MRVFLFVVLFYTIQFCLKAQTVSLKLLAGPTYSFNNLTSSNRDEVWKQAIKQTEDSEKAKWGYSFGAEIEAHLSKKFSVSTGVSYISIGEKASTQLFENMMNDELYGTVTVNYSYSYKYLSLPLHVHYYFPLGKSFKISSFAGMNFNFLQDVDYKESEDYGFGGKTVFFDYKKLVYEGMLGLALSYSITPALSFDFSNSFNLPLTYNSWYQTSDAFIKQTKLKEYKSYFSSQLGIKYSIESKK
jgi:hypothetical protein